MNSRFEALRQMESFTESMFNRIIAFQEKQHPAWDSTLSFDQRIKGLPLHYLIFSAHDRDPQLYGPTIAHYYPLREEIQKIAYYWQQTGAKRLADFYCGNGFMGSLIAREGVNTLGLSQYTAKPNQIERFHDSDCYEFSSNTLEQSQCDAVFVAWPPADINPTPHIVTARPKLLIYVYTDHCHPETKQRQCGASDMFDLLSEQYVLLDQWSITRPENLLHEIWPDMTPNPEEQRHTRIYVLPQFQDIPLPTELPAKTEYPWETDHNMAMLALEAKRQLQTQGILA
ncbi:MAG: hypothetical protein OEZ68_05010 [Gammaproteobacteria bacterium]|nr:hypothetical protein [Gammaproteobacteria bacterium]MDH5800148.1 hypothetical protein [Gammaproteobacteria bacterium]